MSLLNMKEEIFKKPEQYLDRSLESLRVEFGEKSEDAKRTFFEVLDEHFVDYALLSDKCKEALEEHVNEAFNDKSTECAEECHAHVQKYIKVHLNNDLFETLFKEVQSTSSDDSETFTKFVNKAWKALYGCEYGQTVNTWHIEQNAMKTEYSGRESIKELCRSWFVDEECKAQTSNA